MTEQDEASAAQVAAAAPARSTWLSANAGSGKTRVLTQRVARLLLEGTPPQNILCLTYTKAAAGEMQNRLFRTLGEWAMLADDSLAAALRAIGADGGMNLPRARTLFARAIETPGGLKIQTIHSFCGALLRQFPLEAGVSPQFTEIDEQDQKALLAELAEALAKDGQSRSFAGVARYVSTDTFSDLLKSIVANRAVFLSRPTRSELLSGLGLPGEYTNEALLREIDPDVHLIQRLKGALKQRGRKTDTDALNDLLNIGPEVTYSDLPILERRFLTQKDFSSKAGKFPTKDTRARLGSADTDALDRLIDRVAEARPKRLALEAAERTGALHAFATDLLDLYQHEKSRRGWLDFDDLIEKASGLLSDSAAAAWVLYRLDGAIDHILVDEAQDTSPAQWRIIESLTGEFGAGTGARSVDRTLFVVGDKKQSIYSFQGADLEVFDRKKAGFVDQLQAAGGLAELELQYSFRSAQAILDVVDTVFGGGLGGPVSHKAYFDLPGRVDLWPLVPGEDKPDATPWYDTSERVREEVRSGRLAKGIAREIRKMLDDPNATHTEKGVRRRLTPGDFLILVSGRQGQEELFQTLIHACKEAGLPVAGADRMRLESELAVRDLTALLSFLALPEDDLSLAAALRSPLFGWDERRLYSLAAGRTEQYLWAALRNSDHSQTLDILHDLRGRADFLRPFELLERILIRHGGRRKLLARLGDEAEDGIDALLDLALDYERQDVPSLTGFLVWIETRSAEVKRALDQSGGMIRIMTVHGAKGLEAPVVILPDTTRAKRTRSEPVHSIGGTAHWMPTKPQRPPTLDAAERAARARAEEERLRLLYVAMTRAESWLIVCGIEPGTRPEGAWYDLVEQSLNKLESRKIDTPFGPGLRFDSGDWSEAVDTSASETDSAPPRPSWIDRVPAPHGSALSPMSPSDLGGAKALPGEGLDEDEALRRGRLIHRLLEHLPSHAPEDRPSIGLALLEAGDDKAFGEEAGALVAQASALVSNANLGHLFAEGSMAEVAFTARIPQFGDRPVTGIIDRLVPTSAGFLVVDFKTNQVVPTHNTEVPEGVLRQLGAYHEALFSINPDALIEVAVLWTQTATLMPIPPETLRLALSRATPS